MSYINSSLPIARFVANWARTDIFYGATKAVVQASLVNNRITVGDVLETGGKVRSAKITFYPIQCSATGNCTDDICSTGTAIAPVQAWFDITRCIASKVFQLNADDIRLVDDGGMSFSEHALAQFATTMVAMRQALDNAILALLIANVGLLPDGNATMQVNLVDVNGAPNPLGLVTIDQQFAAGFYSNPYIIGAQQLDLYNRMLPLAGPASSGLNLGGLPYHNLFYDPLLNAAFANGKQNILAFDPRVLKFVSYNKNAGIFATDLNGLGDFSAMFRRGMTGSIHGTLVDPVYPIMWDLDAHFNDCTEVWTYRIRLYWDIFFLPPDVCNKQGVNGIMKFTTCDPVVMACPAGTPIPPPVAATQKSWDTTSAVTYPLTVSTITIGTNTTRPNKTAANISDLVAIMNDNASGITFTNTGAVVKYTGNTTISGNINGTITMAFA